MRQRNGRVLVGLLLIALGAFFLISEFTRLPGGAFLVALGLALVAYYLSGGRYWTAVLGSVLAAIGAYQMLDHYRLLVGSRQAWFFLILGLGFLDAYVIGLNWRRLWPLFVGGVLTIVGALGVSGTLLPLAPLAFWRTVIAWWPALLVILGLWVLLRDRLQPGERRLVGGLAVLIVALFGALILLSLAAAISARG